MKRNAPIALSLALAVLLSSCTIYDFKDMDAKVLAAKGQKAKVLSIETKDDLVEFREDDPAKLKGSGIVGNIYWDLELDPFDVADIVPAGKSAKVVLRGGDRLEVLSSVRSEDTLRCEVVKPTWIPLDEVVLAKVKVVDTAASVLATLAGAVIVVGVFILDIMTADEVAVIEDSYDVVTSFVEYEVERSGEPRPRRSVKALLDMGDTPPTAEESEFWVLEWTPVGTAPDENGKLRVSLANSTGMPRGIDEAKIVAVDHPPGVRVAPDSRGFIRTFSEPVPPGTASDRNGDIVPLICARDEEYWRSPDWDLAQGARRDSRDILFFDFPRPPGTRRAKLIVNAANSTWRALFAREMAALQGATEKGGKPAPPFRDVDFAKLRVRLLTVSGWQTGQVIFAAGPLPAETVVYELDLGDVATERVRLELDPPAGYWLIDRVGLDYSEDKPVQETVIGAESVDGPDAADLLAALAAEDGTTAFFEYPGQESALTFAIPAPREGMERTFFLRTVSCYDMPPRAQLNKSGLPNRPVASRWHNPPNRL